MSLTVENITDEMHDSKGGFWYSVYFEGDFYRSNINPVDGDIVVRDTEDNIIDTGYIFDEVHQATLDAYRGEVSPQEQNFGDDEFRSDADGR